MTYPKLVQGDKGKDVSALQTLLNKVGAMLRVDGDYGPGTTAAIRYAQDVARQQVTGIADATLWDFLQKQPQPFAPLDTNGVAFIALEETGGLAYYQRVTRFPHYPGGESGITLGVGYDLRFHSVDEFYNDWSDYLAKTTLQELSNDIGKQGSPQRAEALKNQGIEVPFYAAWQVFVRKTLPGFYKKTLVAYPSLGALPGLCASVLVSLVYNRGPALSGKNREEMANIRRILDQAEQARQQGKSATELNQLLLPVADELLEMKKYWPVTSGVVKRRQLEANLWRESLV
ncbi:peptidoglycan-binding protein [Rheinheimera sp. 4Y26]|uniref:peptidoglycan-binding protein n=1 Tax=Rheinheimera sp. 4Y26 TaxID=2977811 RepID=UPI0021B0DD31|nr:peptidoglycan-binding protein [Rheinheimera sp. 4Y26]MCT6698642.1 peptidoglycan-binding protein [Rheinheimera sp. 4Y26]